jgi:S-adenosylmethionine-diacylglycerol 3-amino-3-carboxypropyl transferase
MSAEQVLDAVVTRRLLTSQGLMQRLFVFWFDAFVYNQIWEDPQVDLEALQLGTDSRVLTISSGGCNALNYLAAGPESVTAVDLNRYHIYLLELKLAALRSLPDHEDFFAFFGLGKHPSNLENYRRYIAPILDDDARRFWESSGLLGNLLLRGKRINYFEKGGLYDHSRNGYFLRFFHGFAHLVGLRPEKILEANSAAEQKVQFDHNIAPFFDSLLIRTLGRLPVTMFGLGIPPQQLEELKQDVGSGSLVDVYRERIRRLACDYPINENYFAWQAFARRYDTASRIAIPDYLKAENFETLKANAHRIRPIVGSVTDRISSEARHAFNRFVFLDAQDWMNAATMTELWQQIAEKGEPGSRIIFRTAGARSPLEKNLPADLLLRFRYDADHSKELSAKDRVSIYGGFHVYELERL